MYTQIGSCPQCGAPIWTRTIDWSVLPPAPIYTCNCVRHPNIIYKDNTSNNCPQCGDKRRNPGRTGCLDEHYGTYCSV